MADNFTKKAQRVGKRIGHYLSKKVLPGGKDEPSKTIDDDWLLEATERAHEAYEHNRQNMQDAYEDLEFLAGDQWPEYARKIREAQRRSCQTFNQMGQFVNRITGEIRMNRAAIKVVPIDAKASAPVGDLMAGMCRYIENRSEAQFAYNAGGDSQVAAGMGAWRVAMEFAEATTQNQELRVVHIKDAISVLFDPDAVLPTREDAQWLHVPIDMSSKLFKSKWPDVPAADFSSYDRRFADYWSTAETVRISEYWEKRPFKRTVACMPDGSVVDLTDKDPDEVKKAKAEGAKISKRDGFKIYKSLITLGHVLEEAEEWPGMFFPIIPAIGDEIHIGRKTVRKGIIRDAKDAQRSYNFGRSTQSDVVAFAPKAPWLGTERNFEDYEDEWAASNDEAFPYLKYKPDPANGGQAPARNQPPMGSSGLSEAIQLARGDMQSVIGIYDASLGQRSNETSGVAIKSRQQEGDIGSVRLIANYNMAIRHTARVMVDLIPHVYDTERQIQVLGEDGKVQSIWINKELASDILSDEPEDAIDLDGDEHDGDNEDGEIILDGNHGDDEDYPGAQGDGADGDENAQGDDVGIDVDDAPVGSAGNIETDDSLKKVDDKARRVLNDMTVGSYDIAYDTGPTYTEKRQQSADGMTDLLKAAPQATPLILDLVAKAQDWPLHDEIAKRLEVMLPPPIQALLAKERMPPGEIGPNGEPLIPNAQPGAGAPGMGPGGPLPNGAPGAMPPGAPPGMPPGAPGAPPAPGMPMPPPEVPGAPPGGPMPPQMPPIEQAKMAKAAADAHMAVLNVQAKEIELETKKLELTARHQEMQGGHVAHSKAISDTMGELAHHRGILDALLQHHAAQAVRRSQPPVQGARRAPDGLWYLPDPQRPGKYLLALHGPDASAPQQPQPQPQ